MKVKVTKEKIWWYTINENVPSKSYFDEFKKNMYLKDLRVNFNNLNNVSIVSNEDNITYVWINHLEKDYFYIVTGITKLLNGGYVLNLQLDIWTTFGLDYFNKLQEKKVKVLSSRSHIYDKKSIQFNDTLLSSIPLKYDNIGVEETPYEANADGDYANGFITVKKPDFNMNMYFVFADTESNEIKYSFVPLIWKSGEHSVIFESETVKEKYFADYANFEFYNMNKNKIPSEVVDREFLEASNNGTRVDFKIRASRNNAWAFTIGDAKWLKEYKLNFDTIVNDKILEYKTFSFIDNNIFDFRFDYSSPDAFITMSKNLWKHKNAVFNESYVRFIDFAAIYDLYHLVADYCGTALITFYTKGGQTTHLVKNNYNNLAKDLIKDSKWSNKFVGVYFLPHLLSFKNFSTITDSRGNKYLSLDINSMGEEIIPFNLCNLELDGVDRFNNPNPMNINVFKYFKYQYYNNILDITKWSDYVNGKNSVLIKGFFYFANNGVIIDKHELLSLENSTLQYTYQLPIAKDTYINYVNATKNTADTTYSVTKQSAIANGVLGALGGIADIGIGALSLKTSLGRGTDLAPTLPTNWLNNSWYDNGLSPFMQADLSNMVGSGLKIKDNWLAALGSASVLKGGLQIAGSITNSILSVNQLESKMRSHYADKNNSLGNQMLPSNVIDAMWLYYYNEDGRQYNAVMKYNLSTETIMMLNNIIYLFGEYNLRYADINDLIPKYRDFYFLQLDKELLSLYFLSYNDAPLQFKDDVLSYFEKGIRVWNTKPTYIEYSKEDSELQNIINELPYHKETTINGDRYLKIRNLQCGYTHKYNTNIGEHTYKSYFNYDNNRLTYKADGKEYGIYSLTNLTIIIENAYENDWYKFLINSKTLKENIFSYLKIYIINDIKVSDIGIFEADKDYPDIYKIIDTNLLSVDNKKHKFTLRESDVEFEKELILNCKNLPLTPNHTKAYLYMQIPVWNELNDVMYIKQSFGKKWSIDGTEKNIGFGTVNLWGEFTKINDIPINDLTIKNTFNYDEDEMYRVNGTREEIFVLRKNIPSTILKIILPDECFVDDFRFELSTYTKFKKIQYIKKDVIIKEVLGE